MVCADLPSGHSGLGNQSAPGLRVSGSNGDSVTVVLQCRYSGVTVTLQWYYSSVTGIGNRSAPGLRVLESKRDSVGE
jgi:hypothetical protein